MAAFLAPTSGTCPIACPGARAGPARRGRDPRRPAPPRRRRRCCSPATPRAAPRPSSSHYGLSDYFAPAAPSARRLRPPVDRPQSPRGRRGAGGGEVTRGGADGRHRRHPARYLLRKSDRRAHGRGRQRPGLHARGARGVPARTSRSQSCPTRNSSPEHCDYKGHADVTHHGPAPRAARVHRRRPDARAGIDTECVLGAATRVIPGDLRSHRRAQPFRDRPARARRQLRLRGAPERRCGA